MKNILYVIHLRYFRCDSLMIHLRYFGCDSLEIFVVMWFLWDTLVVWNNLLRDSHYDVFFNVLRDSWCKLSDSHVIHFLIVQSVYTFQKCIHILYTFQKCIHILYTLKSVYTLCTFFVHFLYTFCTLCKKHVEIVHFLYTFVALPQTAVL